MAIAHICLGCGADLARIHVIRDPHYRLPIVTCPGCGEVCVRRVDPILQRWRTFQPAAAALCILLVQVLIVLSLAPATALVIDVVPDILPVPISGNVFDLLYDQSIAAMVVGVTLPVLTGVWMTTGLGHWRPWLARAVWGLLIAGLLSWDVLRLASETIGNELGIVSGIGAGAHLKLAFYDWILRVLVLFVFLMMTFAGSPLGAVLLKIHAQRRNSRWSRRRARLRRRMRGG
ncbi:MAG: hypothetical protein IIA64_02910 [Planctomycetes bacterium]|nr:hypothetical protein [Planctomycetota bacterium]